MFFPMNSGLSTNFTVITDLPLLKYATPLPALLPTIITGLFHIAIT